MGIVSKFQIRMRGIQHLTKIDNKKQLPYQKSPTHDTGNDSESLLLIYNFPLNIYLYSLRFGWFSNTKI